MNMNKEPESVMMHSLELLCLTAELASFSLAAKKLGLTPAAVSRQIARLEQRLGVTLFVRTTRSVRLTEAGTHYVMQCRAALAQLQQAEFELTNGQQSPVGSVRISLPAPYAQIRVLPLLAEFHAMYPQIKLDLHISTHNVDLFRDGFDLAIRAREQKDSGLVSRKLEDAELVVVGSPRYLQRVGIPHTLQDLSVHQCIQFVLPSSGLTVPWLFNDNGLRVELPTAGWVCFRDDLFGGLSLARHHAGLLQTMRLFVEDDIKAGVLQEVLPTYAGISRPFSLIYPKDRYMPKRVRVLIDFLLQKLQQV